MLIYAISLYSSRETISNSSLIDFNSENCIMQNRIQNDAVSDTTDDDSSHAAKYIIIQLQFKTISYNTKISEFFNLNIL